MIALVHVLAARPRRGKVRLRVKSGQCVAPAETRPSAPALMKILISPLQLRLASEILGVGVRHRRDVVGRD